METERKSYEEKEKKEGRKEGREIYRVGPSWVRLRSVDELSGTLV